MTPVDLHEWTTELVATVGVLVIAAVAARVRWAQGKTARDAEAVKQAGSGGYIDIIEKLRADTDRVRQQAHEDHLSAIEEKRELREINAQVRREFEAWRVQMQKEVTASNCAVSDLRGEVAQLRGENVNLVARVEELLAQIEKTRLTHEWEQNVWRNRYHTLETQHRILVNAKYGDGTATEIMGPADT